MPSRRRIVRGVIAGVLSAATGWLEPLRRDDSPHTSRTLRISVVNEHAVSHTVSVQVGGGAASAVETTTSLDGTTSRDPASVLPEVSGGEASDVGRYEVAVSVDGRQRVSTMVSQDVDSIRVRIDVIGTVEIDRTTSAE